MSSGVQSDFSRFISRTSAYFVKDLVQSHESLYHDLLEKQRGSGILEVVLIQKAAELIGGRLFFFFPQSAPGHMEHPWDYVAHFIVSFASVGILYLALFFPLKKLGVHPGITVFISAGVTLVIGIIKEVSDKNLGKTDMAGDMLANILGIAAVLLLIFLGMKMLH